MKTTSCLDTVLPTGELLGRQHLPVSGRESPARVDFCVLFPHQGATVVHVHQLGCLGSGLPWCPMWGPVPTGKGQCGHRNQPSWSSRKFHHAAMTSEQQVGPCSKVSRPDRDAGPGQHHGLLWGASQAQPRIHSRSRGSQPSLASSSSSSRPCPLCCLSTITALSLWGLGHPISTLLVSSGCPRILGHLGPGSTPLWGEGTGHPRGHGAGGTWL